LPGCFVPARTVAATKAASITTARKRKCNPESPSFLWSLPARRQAGDAASPLSRAAAANGWPTVRGITPRPRAPPCSRSPRRPVEAPSTLPRNRAGVGADSENPRPESIPPPDFRSAIAGSTILKRDAESLNVAVRPSGSRAAGRAPAPAAGAPLARHPPQAYDLSPQRQSSAVDIPSCAFGVPPVAA